MLAVLRKQRWALGWVIVTILSVCSRWMVPINPAGIMTASLDQGLFERLAASIRRGEWLGAFTETTLSKGPGYSLLLGYTARVHIPLQVVHQLSYLAGAAAVGAAIYFLTRSKRAALIGYVVLAFDPVNFGSLGATVTRENVYTGLSLAFVVGTFLLVLGALRRWPWPWLAAVGLPTGGTGAIFWLCREEGIWVGPSLALVGFGLTGLYASRWWRDRRSEGAVRKARASVIGLAVAFVTLCGSFVLPIRVVHHRNAFHYGVGLTTDFASGSFPAAFSTWTRVRGVKLRNYVPINTAQRRAVYRVSPAARELEPFLEDPNNGWKQWACPKNPYSKNYGSAHLNICDDLAGGVAPWAMRDAAKKAGHFENAIALQNFFARVDREIRAACSDGRLQCSRALPAGLQFAERASFGDVARSAWHWTGQLVDAAYVFDLYSPARVNEIPANEREEIKFAVVGTADSHAEALRAAERYHDRRFPHVALGWLYRILGPLLLVAAIVKFVGSLVRRRVMSAEASVLVAALCGGAVVRLVMFSVIDTTQYFNELRYQLATRAFLFAAAVVVLAAPVRRWSTAARSGEATAQS